MRSAQHTWALQPQIMGILHRYADGAIPRSLFLQEGDVPKDNGGTKKRAASTTISLERLLAFCGEHLPTDRSIQCVLDLGALFERHGDLVRAEEMYTFALAKGELHSEHSAIGEALIRRGGVYYRLGRRRDSNADLTEGRKIYRHLNEEIGIGRADSILGLNYAVGGNVKKGETYLKRALNSFERLDDKLLSGVAHMNLGVVQRILGDNDKSLQHLQRARSQFEEAGDQALLAEVHYRLGTTYIARSELDQALAAFEICATLSATLSNQRLIGLAYHGKAAAYFRRGDVRAALTFADMALDRFSISDDRSQIASLYALKGAVHRHAGKLEFAHWYLYTSLKVHEDMENFLAAGEVYAELGRLHIERGRLGEAKRAFRKSIERYKCAGAVMDVKLISEELQALRGKNRSEFRRSRKTAV